MKALKGFVPFLKKYGVTLGVFCFGFHLHAQALGMKPLWSVMGGWGGEKHWGYLEGKSTVLWTEGRFYRKLGHMAANQAVTGRWLMLAGLGIWVGVRYGLFERFRGGSDKSS